MSSVLQINVDANLGSTGKIAEQIGLLAIKNGYDTYMAYGRRNNNSQLDTIKIGSNIDFYEHAFETRLFDNHGLSSRNATYKFIDNIKNINPDIIHLHNIHGYYLNYPILFKYLKEWGGPVVWTLHDCWPFTGHCAYFMLNGCEKWKSHCEKCPSLRSYPSSFFIDNSTENYDLKKKLFSSISSQLTIVPVSNYIANYIPYSILKDSTVKVIHNGVDLNTFYPTKEVKEKLILGVANVWEPRKGLPDFIKLRNILPDEYKILLVGVSEYQKKHLPERIDGLTHTSNVYELAKIYSKSLALVNPTYEDNYPTVNLEAIACGTPVITYRTGGSPESIDDNTGIVVERGNIDGLFKAIQTIEVNKSKYSIENCRRRAISKFNNQERFQEYIDLYNSLLDK